jgi:hypothetical protein
MIPEGKIIQKNIVLPIKPRPDMDKIDGSQTV